MHFSSADEVGEGKGVAKGDWVGIGDKASVGRVGGETGVLPGVGIKGVGNGLVGSGIGATVAGWLPEGMVISCPILSESVVDRLFARAIS